MAESGQSYKEAIRDLYLVRDMTRKEVMSKMDKTYGFKASAGQYERWFKQWGFRKNLAPTEWQFVSRSLDKRKRDGKETDLRIDGIPVPAKKLQKAISRYGQGPTWEKLNHEMVERVRSPTPPRGVRLCTPPAPSRPPDQHTLPWSTFFASTSAWLHLNPGSLRGFSEALVGQSSAPTQTLIRAYIPDVGFDSRAFQPASDVSTFGNFALATFFISNRIQVVLRDDNCEAMMRTPSMISTIHPLRVSNVIQALKSMNTQHWPTIDALSQSLFKEALQSQNTRLVEHLLENFKFDMADLLPGPWPTYERGSPLHKLPWANSQDVRPPFQVAIESGNLQLVQLLLDHGADVSIVGAGGCDMFTVAACVRSEDIISLLLKRFDGDLVPLVLTFLEHRLTEVVDSIWPQARISISGREELKTEVLTEAVRAGHIQIIQDLLESGVNVNSLGRNGYTPLEAACEFGQKRLDVAKLLVKWGGEVDFRLRKGSFRGPTPLQNAVRRNEFELAAFLIHEGADPNAEAIRVDFRSPPLWINRWSLLDGYQALNIALKEDSDLRVINLLLEAGAETDDMTIPSSLHHEDFQQVFGLLRNHNAPLSVRTLLDAARALNKDCVQFCLDAGVDVNGVCDGRTALFDAFRGLRDTKISESKVERLCEICKVLFDRGADVNLGQNVFDGSALSYALMQQARTNRGDLVELFLSKGAHCGNSPVLEHAVEIGDPILLERVLVAAASRPGFNEAFASSCLGHEALFQAAQDNNVRAAEILIRKGINLKSACATSALLIACKHGGGSATDFIELMLTSGVSANFSQCYNLKNLLLTKRCNGPHMQPLQERAYAGDVPAMRLLLRHGANPNLYGRKLTNCFNSILSSAAEGGHLMSVEVLLEAGAEVNQPTCSWSGRTPLQSAAEQGHIHIVEFLLDKGADVNAEPAEDSGVTALQAAAIGGFVAIAAKLIEHGAHVNAPAAKKKGRTALEGACEHGRIDMVELLVRADADLRSAQYDRAMAFAKRNGHGPVARLLKTRREESLTMDEFFNITH